MGKITLIFSLALSGLSAAGARAQTTKLPPRRTAAPVSTPANNRSSMRTEVRPTPSKLPENGAVQPSPAPVARQPQRPANVEQRVAAPVYRSRDLAYEKGDNLLQIGVGLSSYYYGNPIGITYEAGVDKDISVGVQLDYNSGTYGGYTYYGYSSYYRWGYTATYVGARVSYHANRLLDLGTDKVDIYAGLGLGYVSFKWKDSNYNGDADYNSRLFFNYFIGGRYYFTQKIGAFAEVGYNGLSATRIGLTATF